MIRLTPCIRSKKHEYEPLKIRIATNGTIAYLSTRWMAKPEWVLSDGSITSQRLNKDVSRFIDDTMDTLNLYDTSGMTANQIRMIIDTGGVSSPSFSEFARNYMVQIERDGKRWDLWHQAVKSLSVYLRLENIKFSDLTAKALQGWYDSLKKYKRASVLYPQLVRRIYVAGMRAYNDPDRGTEVVKPYPDDYIVKPKPAPSFSASERKSLTSAQIRTFAGADLSGDRTDQTDAREWTRAVCMLSFCLAGINVADLYDLTADSYKDGKICYYRAKTRGKRTDGAYMEVTVPDVARQYLNILMSWSDDGRLLNLSSRYACARKDVRWHIQKTLKTIAKLTGLPQNMSIYTFRYSFASIAVNECGVPLEEVAFALNHATAHRVTAGYVKKDFSRVARVVEAVLKKVFTALPNR